MPQHGERKLDSGQRYTGGKCQPDSQLPTPASPAQHLAPPGPAPAPPPRLPELPGIIQALNCGAPPFPPPGKSLLLRLLPANSEQEGYLINEFILTYQSLVCLAAK